MSNSKVAYSLSWWPAYDGGEEYNGPLVSLFGKMWPNRGEVIWIDTDTGETKTLSTPLNPTASAFASLVMGDKVTFDYEVLAQETFRGDTNDVVRAQVEEWAKTIIGRMEKALRAEFEEDMLEIPRRKA